MLHTIIDTFPKIRCNTYTGTNSKSERAAILKGFENGSIDVLLAMKCLDEELMYHVLNMVFLLQYRKSRQFIQRRGRLLRKHPDKTFAYIYDMIVVPDFQSVHYSREFLIWKGH